MTLSEQADNALKRMALCKRLKKRTRDHQREAVRAIARLLARSNQAHGAHYTKAQLAALGAVRPRQSRLRPL